MHITPTLHSLMILFSAVLCALILVWGQWSTAREDGGRSPAKLGLAMLVLWVIYNIYYFLPEQFNWYISLPLHACDIVAVVAAAALIKRSRAGSAILYFGALPLTTQALATPIGNQDPSTLRFWLYWTLHAGIIACSLFDLVVNRYRPRFRDLGIALVTDIVYFSLMIPVNIAFSWNYGYLGERLPEEATLLDFLGPWPERILVMFLLVISIQGLMLVPWMAQRRHGI